MTKYRVLWLMVISVAVSLAATSLVSQEKGGGDETGPYDLVPNWPQNPCGPGFRVGSTAGIFAESPDKVFIFQRGCLPIVENDAFGTPHGLAPARDAATFDLAAKDPSLHPRWDHILYIVNRDGKMIDSWEQHNQRFVRPHKVLINPYDPEKHVWLVDDGAQQIFKLTNDGKQIVMTLGEFKVQGNDEKHFARPTDIAWLPDGTFFVTDGYTNTRVVKFDKDGKFLMTWGQKGTPPNETRPSYMNTVHSHLDRSRSADSTSPTAPTRASRSSTRTASSSTCGRTSSARTTSMMSQDQHLWIADGITQKFLKFDLNGHLIPSATWGTFGAFPGGFWGVHQFHVDSEGNLYTADVHIGRPQKFKPKPGVDKARLVGPMFKASGSH